MAISKETKAGIVSKFGKGEKNTGGTEVQIALLTAKIQALTDHLKDHQKDHAARRGLLILVGQRRGLLDYLAEIDRDRYLKVIAELKIRK